MLPPALKFDEKAELEQVNVLYSFLENRYAKKVIDFPLEYRFDFLFATAFGGFGVEMGFIERGERKADGSV